MTESSRQWKRRAEVVIGKSGSGLLITDLRIKFEVAKTVDATPNTALISIYNLSPENEARVKNEFDEVLLNAGYEDAMRLVFRGNIKHVYRYREANDYITEIEAGDGDKDYRNAVMNETLAAGTSNKHLFDRAHASMPSAVAKPYADIPEKQRIRGKVISGNTRDVLTDLARDSGANWSIQDGKLVMVKADTILPGEAIVIRADTGMLGAPEVNEKGITVKCLLNPQIRINGALQLDNNDIKKKREKLGKVQQTGQAVVADENTLNGTVRLDPDGVYKAIKISHKGDTRGGSGDWITETVCVSLDSQAVSKKKRKK